MSKDWANPPGVDLLLELPGGQRRAGLEDALREAVRGGRLAAGTLLPSSRALAAELGMARNTVADAYGQLVAEGWLTARQGAGTRVADRTMPAAGRANTRHPTLVAGRRAYDLTPGSPDLAGFPRGGWLAASRRALIAAPSHDLGYPDPRGLPGLRETLAQYLARVRGVRTAPDHIIICSGFVQALNLLSVALRHRGAGTIAVESYGFWTHRDVIHAAGLATPASVTLPKETFHDLGATAVLERIVATLGLPLFVKPARGGSALGATRVDTAAELPGAMISCFAYGDTALIERCVVGTEIAVGVLDLGEGPQALPAVEIHPLSGGYDYAARYTAGQTRFWTPARLSAGESAAAAAAAVSAHRALGLRDLSRTDLIISGGQVFFLEVNVAPGMTETSTLPMAMEAAGRALGITCRDLLGIAAARGS
jgi:D-alanine--D-alanine ligase